MTNALKMTLVYVLSIPLLVFGIILDIVKFPLLLFIIWPIWAFLDLIDWLKGEEPIILTMMKETAFMGIEMWWEMVS